MARRTLVLEKCSMEQFWNSSRNCSEKGSHCTITTLPGINKYYYLTTVSAGGGGGVLYTPVVACMCVYTAQKNYLIHKI